MPDSGSDELLRRQKEFFSSFFRRGAEATDELLRENERLTQELLGLGRRYDERLAQMEHENHALASLYVAAYQLHASLELRVVARTICEIASNFIGAKTFALCLRAGDGEGLRAACTENVDAADLPPLAVPTELTLADSLHPGTDPRRGPPAITVPLRLRGEVVGALLVWDFLAQKTSLEQTDRELFNLLEAHAGLALEAARLAAGGPGKRLDHAAVQGLLGT